MSFVLFDAHEEVGGMVLSRKAREGKRLRLLTLGPPLRHH